MKMNTDPLAKLLHKSLHEAPLLVQLDLLKDKSETEFIASRIEQYYQVLEKSAKEGNPLSKAEQLALQTLFKGIKK